MKKAFAFFISAVIFISFSGSAQPNTDNQSLLWRISGKGMSKPSYLFGTIHLICPDDYLWTDKMKQSLYKSEELCLEMNISDPAVLLQVAEGFIDNNGKTLKDYFTAEQYKKIQTYIKDSLGMDVAMFQQMKPMALQMLFVKNTAGCADPVSYEEKLVQTAKEENKEVAGLEDPKEQIAVLESLPVDSVIKEVIETVTGKENENDRNEYNKMVACYKRQDLPALYEQIQASKDLDEDLGAFLDDRNKKWIDRMTGKMEQKSVFFAVGAGHLWGQNGVINLLRKAGYTVTAEK
jgi:uncharacterized protein YbaP (TraB family)